MRICEICGTTSLKKRAEESPTDYADLHGYWVRNYSPTDVTDLHGCGCVIILPQITQIYTDVGCVRKNTNSTNYTNAAQKNLWESVKSVGEYPQAKSVRIRVICGRISSGKICGNPCDLWENVLKQNLWESVRFAGV